MFVKITARCFQPQGPFNRPLQSKEKKNETCFLLRFCRPCFSWILWKAKKYNKAEIGLERCLNWPECDLDSLHGFEPFDTLSSFVVLALDLRRIENFRENRWRTPWGLIFHPKLNFSPITLKSSILLSLMRIEYVSLLSLLVFFDFSKLKKKRKICCLVWVEWDMCRVCDGGII